MAVGEPEAPYLELLDVAKHFGGVQALDRVSLGVRRGSVHALVGENGAGKSTLGRIVAGALIADGGPVLLDGEPVAFGSPREALEQGVAAIAQEPIVVPQLTVAENVLLGAEPRRRRLRPDAGAQAALRRSSSRAAGFDLRGDVAAEELGTAEQQKVEILRALSRDAQLIVMDEPTAALDARETGHLHEIVRSLAASGTTIILISHFLKRGAPARRHRHGAAGRPAGEDGAGGVRDRGVAGRGDARPAADVDVPAEGRAAGGRSGRALGARPVRRRASRT